MSTEQIKTRARTVHHLGAEQIADCPTAISELWKNAYDAYAKAVSLHVFDGMPCVAAILDNGHGMNRREFVDGWLTVGADTKADDRQKVPEADMFGLPERPRQGQKGIGRLAVGYLGPTLVVLTKRMGYPYVLSVIDWRLFANPYLNLEDIRLPVEEFEDKRELKGLVDKCLDVLVDNVWPRGAGAERDERVRSAWARYDRQAPQDLDGNPVSVQIANGALLGSLGERQLKEWDVWNGKSEHGTGLFVLGAMQELRDLLSGGGDDLEEDDSRLVRNQTVATLSAFVDPYSQAAPEFDYRVISHNKSVRRTLVSREQNFGWDSFARLEHTIVGEFDQAGVFRGEVRAFGKERGEYEFTPRRPPAMRADSSVGPFVFAIGTFEQLAAMTTHSTQELEFLLQQAERFSGLMVFRDGLRIMPYGRPDADFFELESRRGKHAGRYYFAHRRVFGHVATNRRDNPNLRDKAGREGLIDNRARREMRYLVQELLRDAANKFFGSDSPIRMEELPQIEAQNAAAKEAEERVRKRRVGEFRDFLKTNAPKLGPQLLATVSARTDIELATASRDVHALQRMAAAVDECDAALRSLRLPPKPARLDKTEERYRAYRDQFAELSTAVASLKQSWATGRSQMLRPDPEVEARSAFARNQKLLHDELGTRRRRIEEALQAETARILDRLERDRAEFYHRGTPVVSQVADQVLAIDDALSQLESIRETLRNEKLAYYDGYARALAQLSEGIDLDAAVRWSSDERVELKETSEKLLGLAQLGIAVEMIAHELDALDTTVMANLNRLPETAQATDSFRIARDTHRELVVRLQFLAPLKLSGPRMKEQISGKKIESFVRDFFKRTWENSRTRFVCTQEFREITLVEFTGRVFPVFTNLVANALYWLTFVEDREIRFDVRDDAIVIADSGRGVDPEDVGRLFQIFFTRRITGRGVGLYLCRENLAQGGHQISYVTAEEQKVLPGANFAIRFKGLKRG